ncbi:MAG: hypothetical protein JXA35_09820 [Deltaproteobacteria bacterium]|nr:hypothetical protein [Deltaproteobacteria bacterium]
MPQKDCFGILNRVFPVGKEGFRESGTDCSICDDKKECMQKALKTEDGLQFRAEILDRIPARGFIQRIKRWSDRKDLSRRKHET